MLWSAWQRAKNCGTKRSTTLLLALTAHLGYELMDGWKFLLQLHQTVIGFAKLFNGHSTRKCAILCSSSLNYIFCLSAARHCCWSKMFAIICRKSVTRLVTGIWRCDHVMPVIHLLHWLPVCRLVHQSLTGNSSSYWMMIVVLSLMLVSDDYTPQSRACIFNRTHSTFVDRSFAATVPSLWNSLPPYVKDVDLSCSWFRRSLKTFFVWTEGPRRSVNYFNCAV